MPRKTAVALPSATRKTYDDAFKVKVVLEALRETMPVEAIERYGTPDVFNTDQGAQFTSTAFTDVLNAHGVKISMDVTINYIT